MDWFPTHNLCASSIYHSSLSLCTLTSPLWALKVYIWSCRYCIHSPVFQHFACSLWGVEIRTNGLKLTLTSYFYRYNKVHHTQILWKYMTYFNFPNYSFPTESSRHKLGLSSNCSKSFINFYWRNILKSIGFCSTSALSASSLLPSQ